MERERLLSSTNKYKQALENQVESLKQGAAKFALQGLVFGGVALGTYLIVRAFQKKSEPKEEERNLPARTSFGSAIFASIQSYVISFLLSLAREKIIDYLESYLAKQHDAPSKVRA